MNKNQNIKMDSLTKMLIEKATPDMIADGLLKNIAEEIGMPALCKISYFNGGSQVYVPKLDELLMPVKYKAIKEEFDGSNYEELAKKYNVTESTVRSLVLN